MPLQVHWFLPTSGDSREIVGFTHREAVGGGVTEVQRPPDIDYLAQIARAADQLGYTAVLTPTGTWCEDAWLTTAALLRETRRLKFLVAFRPGFLSPTLAAQMAATYQRHSGGRLLLNVVTGGDIEEQRRFGDWLDHDQRYERTDEFLSIVRGAWSGRPYDFEGSHYRVAGAVVPRPPDPVPAVFFGGASPAAERVAARQVDVYLAWGEPPNQIAERLDRVRGLAADAGRRLRFGIRLHVISRDTAAQAWAVADRLLAALDPAAIEAAHQRYSTADSVGQQRMAALHGGRTDQLEIYPNLWAGYGLVRGGAGTALVGSHQEVADRIEEYHALGLDHFILSGQPHLEEAYEFGEGVLPLLRARGLLAADGADPSYAEPALAGVR
ncbi:MAG TPA: LLM class flavin-dependent oxidoreductase [Mycobacteriales bacterium]|nr:LLM class flavin-dependent oxidoreductase [Mycobacteriales bacterium]